MKCKKVSRKNLTVTHLVKTFNLMLNLRKGKHLSSQCTCVLRMYNECVGGGGDDDDDDTCPIHFTDDERDIEIDMILKSFSEKSLLYVSTAHIDKIIYNRHIQMSLPMVIHLFAYKDNFSFTNRSVALKLNNALIKYAHLLIVNFIQIDSMKRLPVKCNELLTIEKVIKFKYAIFINSFSKQIQNYLERDHIDNCFIFKLKSFVNLKDTN